MKHSETRSTDILEVLGGEAEREVGRTGTNVELNQLLELNQLQGTLHKDSNRPTAWQTRKVLYKGYRSLPCCS